MSGMRGLKGEGADLQSERASPTGSGVAAGEPAAEPTRPPPPSTRPDGGSGEWLQHYAWALEDNNPALAAYYLKWLQGEGEIWAFNQAAELALEHLRKLTEGKISSAALVRLYHAIGPHLPPPSLFHELFLEQLTARIRGMSPGPAALHAVQAIERALELFKASLESLPGYLALARALQDVRTGSTRVAQQEQERELERRIADRDFGSALELCRELIQTYRSQLAGGLLPTLLARQGPRLHSDAQVPRSQSRHMRDWDWPEQFESAREGRRTAERDDGRSERATFDSPGTLEAAQRGSSSARQDGGPPDVPWSRAFDAPVTSSSHADEDAVSAMKIPVITGGGPSVVAGPPVSLEASGTGTPPMPPEPAGSLSAPLGSAVGAPANPEAAAPPPAPGISATPATPGETRHGLAMRAAEAASPAAGPASGGDLEQAPPPTAPDSDETSGTVPQARTTPLPETAVPRVLEVDSARAVAPPPGQSPSRAGPGALRTPPSVVGEGPRPWHRSPLALVAGMFLGVLLLWLVVDRRSGSDPKQDAADLAARSPGNASQTEPTAPPIPPASGPPGTLSLTIEPGDKLELYLNDVLIPGGNIERLELPSGRHTMKVFREAYEPYAQVLWTQADAETRMQVTLTKSPVVTVKVSPSDKLEIRVDERRVGVSSPLKGIVVEPGRHRLEVTRSGYRPYSEEFTAVVATTHRFDVALQPVESAELPGQP